LLNPVRIDMALWKFFVGIRVKQIKLHLPESPVSEDVIRSNAIKEMSDNRFARGGDSYDAMGY